MAATGSDDARDSRDWPLPPYLEQVGGGVRLRSGALPWTKLVLMASIWIAIAVFYGVTSSFGSVVVGVIGGSVLLVVAPFAIVWTLRRGVVPAADLRLASWYCVGVVAALTGFAFVVATVATLRDIAAGELFAPGVALHRLLAGYTIFPVMLGAWLAGLTLRAARRVDPATPPAVLPRDRSLRPLWYAVDYGEAGARFPQILPLAFVAPVAATLWLSIAFGNLAYRHEDTIAMVAMGGALGLVPLFAGVAWWPWLPAAVTRGLRPRQLRAVGLTSVVSGAVGGLGAAGAVVTMAAAVGGGGSNVLFGLLGLLMVGGLLAVSGGQLVVFGRRLRRAGLHPDAG